MRKSLLWTLCLLLVPAVPSAAQTPAPGFKQRGPAAQPEAPTSFVKPYESEPYVRPRTPLATQLVYERAAFRAQQRTARLEARKWLGYSTSRPFVREHLENTSFPRHGYPYCGLVQPPHLHIQVP